MLIKASLSNESEAKAKKLELTRWQLANYTRPLFDSIMVVSMEQGNRSSSCSYGRLTLPSLRQR